MVHVNNLSEARGKKKSLKAVKDTLSFLLQDLSTPEGVWKIRNPETHTWVKYS